MSSEQQVEFSGLVLGFCSAALSYLGYGDSQTPVTVSYTHLTLPTICSV